MVKKFFPGSIRYVAAILATIRTDSSMEGNSSIFLRHSRRLCFMTTPTIEAIPVATGESPT